MLGVGGILAEAVADVVFRLVPIDRVDAEDMIDDLGSPGPARPVPGRAGGRPGGSWPTCCSGCRRRPAERPDIASVDVNPLIVVDGRPVAVDALVELALMAVDEQFRALFEPRGVLVAGASTHPGKFGFVSLHNILACGYAGEVFATNREGDEVLGIRRVARGRRPARRRRSTSSSCARRRPPTPTCCASAPKKGITAAFIASAGYGEAGEEGLAAQADLVALADDLGILLAGPNGQGVVSPPARLCAQIVGPFPPAGHIAIASQSGNFVSSFENYAELTGVGVSRAVSAGNAAAVGVPDYLEYFADDPETRVALAYVEGVGDGRAFMSTACGAWPSASRSWSSRAARPRAASGPRPATRAPWPATTGCSTAPPARPACRGPPPSRRASR